MPRHSTLPVIAALLLLPVAVLAQSTDDLPIERVVLFSSGVGYIQHAGQVSGNGAVTLHFTDEQLDDVLKSLVVEDRGGGMVEVATFPSRAAAGTVPRFRISGGESGLTGLLGQLVGAEVEIERPNGLYRGRLIGSERVASGDAERVYISILTPHGIEPIPFEGVTAIRAVDPELQAAIGRALTQVSASYTAPGGDPLQVSFRGSGTRGVTLGYVVRQPLWKTSYRLVLPSGDGRAEVQGWAIVENHTDRDWEGVSLSLVSGRPISFVTRLSRPVFVNRPELDVRVEAPAPAPVRYGAGVPAGVIRGRVLDADTGDPIPGAHVSIERLNQSGVTGRDGSFELRNVPVGQHQVRASMVGYVAGTASADLARGGATIEFRLEPGVQLESVVVEGYRASREVNMDLNLDLSPAPPAPGAGRVDIGRSVAAIAEIGEVGEVFEYAISNVYVARGQAAMLPIVTGRVNVERLSLYQAEKGQRHPLRGFRVRNTSGQHLQAGAATVFDDGAYAGDIYLPDLSAGAEQFLSYAADLDLVVTENLAGERERRLATARIENGVLATTHRAITTSTYTVENRGDRRRTLIVEHPRKAGTLADPQAEEMIGGGYRFRMDVRPGRTETLVIREEDSIEERIEILDSRRDLLAIVARGDRLPPEIRRSLERAAELQRAHAAAQAERAVAERRLEELRAEQGRARENIQALPPDAPFVVRQIRRVEELEAEIEVERARIDDLRAAERQRRQAFESYVRELNVGG